MKKTLKITVNNTNGTSFHYWMHYEDWLREMYFMRFGRPFGGKSIEELQKALSFDKEKEAKRN